MKNKFARICLLALVHVLACIWMLWFLMPRPEGHEKVIEGIPTWQLFAGTKTRDSAISVNGLTLGCRASAVAHSFSCPNTFDGGVISRVTYFEMITLEAALGFASPPLILLKIEQFGYVKYSRDYADLRSQYFGSGILIPLCIFGISFIWLKKKLINKEGK